MQQCAGCARLGEAKSSNGTKASGSPSEGRTKIQFRKDGFCQVKDTIDRSIANTSTRQSSVSSVCLQNLLCQLDPSELPAYNTSFSRRITTRSGGPATIHREMLAEDLVDRKRMSIARGELPGISIARAPRLDVSSQSVVVAGNCALLREVRLSDISDDDLRLGIASSDSTV